MRPPQQVDGTSLADGHEPAARVARDARLGPLLERRYQRILGEVFGDGDVTDESSQPGDEPG